MALCQRIKWQVEEVTLTLFKMKWIVTIGANTYKKYTNTSFYVRRLFKKKSIENKYTNTNKTWIFLNGIQKKNPKLFNDFGLKLWWICLKKFHFMKFGRHRRKRDFNQNIHFQQFLVKYSFKHFYPTKFN